MTAEYKKRAKGGWNNDKDVSNRKERSYEVREIQEQLTDTTKVTKATKKPKQDKDVTRLLSRMRFYHKLCKGDIEYFNKPRPGNEWIRNYYQGYYQEYKKALPELIALSKRDDLPAKILRQIKEVLVLFGIET